MRYSEYANNQQEWRQNAKHPLPIKVREILRLSPGNQQQGSDEESRQHKKEIDTKISIGGYGNCEPIIEWPWPYGETSPDGVMHEHGQHCDAAYAVKRADMAEFSPFAI